MARSRWIPFAYGAPIGVLGGLIGLGGAEFRLPVLAGPLGYLTRRAIPLNLAISQITLLSALMVRSATLSFSPLGNLRAEIVAMIAGTVITAAIGPSVAAQMHDERLEQVIFVLLFAIGVSLIAEGFLSEDSGALVPDELMWRLIVAFVLGTGIGLVSSMLGVAGGEMIIPAFVFAFGAGIKEAGTASLLVSLPTVAVGIVRYARMRSYRREDIFLTVTPMGIGSVLGAVIGGLLAGIFPASALKVVLGLILIASAIRTFGRTRSRTEPQ